MNIIDGHTHLSGTADLNQETNLSEYDIRDIATDYVERLKKNGVEHAVAILLDEDVLVDEASLNPLLDVHDDAGCFSLVFLVDPLSDQSVSLVEKIADVGGVGVKIHPYVQQVGTPDHFPQIRRMLRAVEASDLFTIIDCSYGAEHMYEVNGVRLGHAMAKEIDAPIVLAHGGGAKIHEAFLTAETFSNIYLDTSFSIPYWSGSSVEQDFAFAMREMKMDRWVWGTDSPFTSHEESVEAVRALLEENDLTEYESALFYENMRELLS